MVIRPARVRALLLADNAGVSSRCVMIVPKTSMLATRAIFQDHFINQLFRGVIVL